MSALESDPIEAADWLSSLGPLPTLLMWLGRVEIIPIAVLLSRSYWRA